MQIVIARTKRPSISRIEIAVRLFYYSRMAIKNIFSSQQKARKLVRLSGVGGEF